MWRFVIVTLVIISVVVFGFSLIDISGGDVSANALLMGNETDISAYSRAVDPWDWEFPRDHGAHPDFQTEWWYYTGNIATEEGRRFGYQFTVFRRALTPQDLNLVSEWRTGQVYMAHFTLSDIEAGNFYHEERYSRGGADLAGAEIDPVYRVWLEDWQVMAQDADFSQLAMTAATDTFGVDLTLTAAKPPRLQGTDGLTPRGFEVGNASYYYSMPRLTTEGTITIEGQTYTVTGNTWMDHEFATQALDARAIGWDWFGLIFDNDYELMVGQIRMNGDVPQPPLGGLLVYPDGSTLSLAASDFTIEETATWQSPHTGAVYPSGWLITLTLPDDTLRLTVTPLMDDQELHSGDIIYWEGAVRIEGDLSGYGYAELTGYASALTGRF